MPSWQVDQESAHRDVHKSLLRVHKHDTIPSIPSIRFIPKKISGAALPSLSLASMSGKGESAGGGSTYSQGNNFTSSGGTFKNGLGQTIDKPVRDSPRFTHEI